MAPHKPHEIAMTMLHYYIRVYLQEAGHVAAARDARVQLQVVGDEFASLQNGLCIYQDGYVRAMEQNIEYEKQLGLRKEAQ